MSRLRVVLAELPRINARAAKKAPDVIEAFKEARELLTVALEWMDEQGCDCGTDEPGTCGLCRIREALGR